MKKCSRCKEVKPKAAFGWRTVGSLRSWCKLCSTLAERGKVKSERAKLRGIQLSRQARSFWSEKQFRSAWKKQRGLCEICETPMTETKRSGDTAVHADHDPLLNRPRGLLCKACNVGLGYFKDDPAKLERAAQYLLTHSSKP